VFCDFDICDPFHAQLQSLWPLWEVMLLGKPLLVYAKEPQDCSAAVAVLVSLLSPLPYVPDFRPVLSIHDKQIQNVLVRPALHFFSTLIGRCHCNDRAMWVVTV
jgi:hypothetical protein